MVLVPCFVRVLFGCGGGKKLVKNSKAVRAAVL